MALAFLLLIPILVDILRRPTFRALAVRNISRRRGEALLVVLGGLLGTAIITASFIVGDTITASFSAGARTNLGPIDHAIRATDNAKIDEAEKAIDASRPEGSEGVLRALSTSAVVANTASPRVAEPRAALAEVDFDKARALGADAAVTGMAEAGPTPNGSEAVINDRLATTLSVKAGDPIDVFAYGASKRLTVRIVVAERGIAGYAAQREVSFDPTPPRPVFVAPGTIETLRGASTLPAAAPPSAELLVSDVGGVSPDNATLTSVNARLEALTKPIGDVQVVNLKADLLKQAKATGDSIGQLYTGIGGFSVIAGILLLVNLFVMLAEERKVELGMLRALGFKRNHIVRTFAIEGAIYSILAAFLGGAVGVGVGAVISRIANGIVASDGAALAYELAVKPASLITGIGVGLTISMFTVWGTSFRISRLNVIRAIRDLPEPAVRSKRLWSAAFGGVGVAFGLSLLMVGISGKSAVPAIAGPPIAAFSAIPVLGWFLPRRAVIVGCGTVALLWAVFVFQIIPDVMGVVGIESFLVQGVALVAAAIMILQQLDGMWAAIARGAARMGAGLSARLGLAYPLARRFRTGMLLAMYSLVIFTMTFLSVFSALLGQQEPTITREVSSGFDVLVDSNPANPIDAGELRSFEGVGDVVTLTQGFPLWTTERKTDPQPWPVTGVDAGLLSRNEPPKLSKRLDRFATDQAAYEGVMADPTLALVPDFFLQGGGGPPDDVLKIGEKITARNASSGELRELTIAGLVANDWVFNGVFVGTDSLKEFLGPLTSQRRHYVSVASGADGNDVAGRINGAFVENGADADTFRAKVGALLAQNRSFFSLMNGYLGLGLVIGIAGLGVVMVRAVRERRRQIGMLRAMGFSSSTVRRSFLLEAGFIAFQGSVLGIGLGLLTSYQVLANSDVFGENMAFAIPWSALGIIFAVPFVASLLATAAPATQAARIKPAVALRIAD